MVSLAWDRISTACASSSWETASWASPPSSSDSSSAGSLVMRAQFMCVTISKFLLLLDSPQSTQRRWKIFSVVISASPAQTTPLRWTFSTLRGRASSRQCGGEYGGNFRILPPERCVTQTCLLDVTFPNSSLTLHVPPLPLAS